MVITQAESGVTLTVQGGGATGESNGFDVEAGMVHHFAFAPIGSPQTAGQPFEVTITAQDAYGNTVTDYTGPATLTDTTGTVEPTTIGGFTDSTWAGDVVITQAESGVTLTVQGGGATGESNGFDVEAASLDHITISPASATIVAGGVYTFTAEAYDAYHNGLGDVTAATTFDISSPASGGCNDNVCTAEIAGTWTVTGTHGGEYDTATLIVDVGALDHIVICTDPNGHSPADDHSMTTYDTWTLYAAGYDAVGNFGGNEVVTWGSMGTLDSVSGSGVSYVFAPATAHTSGVIVVDAGNSITDTTGLVTIVAPYRVFIPLVTRQSVARYESAILPQVSGRWFWLHESLPGFGLGDAPSEIGDFRGAWEARH